ncbi:transcriptional regulator, partial [Streptomyces sp. SID7982]|nr:transcriptional regulator [Streptomyces sp. SID7982]
AGTLEAGIRNSVAQVVLPGGMPAAPVVVDVDGIDAVALARHLSAMGLAYLVRLDPQAQLCLDRAKLPK